MPRFLHQWDKEMIAKLAPAIEKMDHQEANRFSEFVYTDLGEMSKHFDRTIGQIEDLLNQYDGELNKNTQFCKGLEGPEAEAMQGFLNKLQESFQNAIDGMWYVKHYQEAYRELAILAERRWDAGPEAQAQREEYERDRMEREQQITPKE